MSGEVTEKIVLGAIGRQLKNKLIGRHSQSSSSEIPTFLISFHFKIRSPHLMDEGKAVDVIFLSFSKTSDTVPHNLLLDKSSNGETHGFTPY